MNEIGSVNLPVLLLRKWKLGANVFDVKSAENCSFDEFAMTSTIFTTVTFFVVKYFVPPTSWVRNPITTMLPMTSS